MLSQKCNLKEKSNLEEKSSLEEKSNLEIKSNFEERSFYIILHQCYHETNREYLFVLTRETRKKYVLVTSMWHFKVIKFSKGK